MKPIASALPAIAECGAGPRGASVAAGRSSFPAFLVPAMLLAALVLFAFPLDELRSATRPRYGGTLRVQLQWAGPSIAPRDAPPRDAPEFLSFRNLSSLVYETLVVLDDAGRPQPLLAAAWESDGPRGTWTFRLRPRVVMHDGTPLSPAVVAASLDIPGASVREGSGDAVLVRCERVCPELLYALADQRHAIFSAASEGPPAGSGAFRIAEPAAPGKLRLSVNQAHWQGRPYLDAIEADLGVSLRDQGIALELGRADVVELNEREARRAVQEGRRLWSSAPIVVLALAVRPGSPRLEGARAWRALSLAIDRVSIRTALLQRQGEASAALLPQWLSGYAFLFPGERDVERARQLWSETPQRPDPVVIEYRRNDSLAVSLADRIALNAREAGIAVRVVAAALSGASEADARLIQLSVAEASLPAVWSAFGERLAPFMRAGGEWPAVADGKLESYYEAERRLLAAGFVMPLAHLPVTYGVSARVRNWRPTRAAQWGLADVWLAVKESS